MTRSFDLFRAGDLVAAPWKNGGGSTREIAAYGGGEAFLRWVRSEDEDSQ